MRAATVSQTAVRSADELLALVVEQIRELDQELQGQPATAEFLWNVCRKSNVNEYRPKDEASISNYVALFLRNRLRSRGIVVNREVEIRRGQETDIHIDAVNLDQSNSEIHTVRVIIEVKGCWHPELQSAIQTQLADRYLSDTKDVAGLYLVGWFRCDKWRKSGDSRQAKTPKWSLSRAREYFEKLAKAISIDGLAVHSIIINATIR